MARLLKTDKEDTIRRALADTFQVREQKVKRELNLAAHQLYEAYFTEEERKLMKTLPLGWLQPVTSLQIKNLLNAGWVRAGIEPAVLLPQIVHEGGMRIDRNNPLHVAAEAAITLARKAEMKLKDDKEVLKKSLEALVFPITTDKKLSEVWPEGGKYMTPIDKSENLPALTSATVVDLMAKFKEG